jgi:hypothetical protein
MSELSAGFSEIRIERGQRSAPVYDGRNLPHPSVEIITGVSACCDGCGTSFQARRSGAGAVPGTFHLFAFGMIQLTCPKCHQQGMFDQADYP